jgi:putative flippase GtrA
MMAQDRDIVGTFLLQKNDNVYIQFFRYLFVGGTAAVVDVGSLYFLTSRFGLYYLLSAAIAFLLGIATNYLLSILWVFRTTGQLKKEILLFVLIGFSALLLNEAIMYSLVSIMSIFYLLAKLISIAITMMWNFGLRKKFVF